MKHNQKRTKGATRDDLKVGEGQTDTYGLKNTDEPRYVDESGEIIIQKKRTGNVAGLSQSGNLLRASQRSNVLLGSSKAPTNAYNMSANDDSGFNLFTH